MLMDYLETWERICLQSGICVRYRNIPRPIWFHIPPAPILILIPAWPVRPYRSWILRGVLAAIYLEACGEDRVVAELLSLIAVPGPVAAD